MEVKGAGVPIQRGEVGFRRKYLAFLVFNRTYRAGSLGNSLKLRRGFGIIGREFYWSVSENCEGVQKCRL